MKKRLLFAALPLAALTLPLAPAPAHAAQTITLSNPGGIVKVYDFAGDAATVIVNGNAIAASQPLNVAGAPGCTNLGLTRFGFMATCTGINGWEVYLGDRADDFTGIAATVPIYAEGEGGDDSMDGTALAGGINLVGGPGLDTLEVHAGNPGRGRELHGGPGADTLIGGPDANDKLFGGGGSDTFHAIDGRTDVIDCGAGDATRDVVNADRGGPFVDSFRNCSANDLR
jgi:hypothetical protein